MNQNFVIEDDVLLYYKGVNKKVIVPENVTVIGDSAFFNNKDIESIILPEGIKGINRWAFKKCSKLKNITLPDSLNYISTEAIMNCDSLKEITIPKNLKCMDIFLRENKKLKKIILKGKYDSDIINYIIGTDNSNLIEVTGPNVITENGVVYNKDKTILISYLETNKEKTFKIPKNVEKICTYSFTENMYLKELHLNEDLKEMEFNSINVNKIKKIIIPVNFTGIDENIFEDVEVDDVKIIIDGSQKQLDENKKLKNILKVIKNIEFNNNKKTLEELISEGKTFKEINSIIKEQER